MCVKQPHVVASPPRCSPIVAPRPQLGSSFLLDFLQYSTPSHPPAVRATALRCTLDVHLATRSPFDAAPVATVATIVEDMMGDEEEEGEAAGTSRHARCVPYLRSFPTSVSTG